MWLLTVLIVLWVALMATWAVLCRRKRRLGRRERRRGRTRRHPAHRPVPGPRLRSAVSVAEIQRRLAAEAARLAPPVRNITIIPPGGSSRAAVSGSAGRYGTGHRTIRGVR